MLDKLTGSGRTIEKQQDTLPKPEFEGFVECPLFSERANVTVDDENLQISALFDQLAIPYKELTAFKAHSCRVELETKIGVIYISQLGNACEWFYNALYDAYNKRVLEALFVEGSPCLETNGILQAEENGDEIHENAVIRLYDDCICSLPPNENARRIPLCFINGMAGAEYGVTLTLITGESYTFSKLGYHAGYFEQCLTDKLRRLRERNLKWIKGVDDTLTMTQASAVSKLMQEGVAAPIGVLHSIAPSFVAELEKIIDDSRLKDTYPVLKQICGAHRLFIGLKPADAKESGTTVAEAGASAATDLNDKEEKAANPVLWLIASDESQRTAAVELALPDDEAAATYFYRVQGDWRRFSYLIDRGMEAVGFRREPISLPDDKIAAKKHTGYAMAIKRTQSLRLIRSRFAGRAVHSSVDRWRMEVEKYFEEGNDKTSGANLEILEANCPNCGAGLSQKARFCGQCGSKMKGVF